MKTRLLILLMLFGLSANAQIVNKFRDSSWFAKGVRFDSTLVISKGASAGKVLTSDAFGTVSWQTSGGGVSQSALNDTALSIRSVRKVDTLYKSADSIIYTINGLRYAIQTDTFATFNFFKNATKDSIIAVHNGVRYAVKDSIANLSGYATTTNLADTSTALRILINAKGTGTVTSVATGYGLSGGTITTSGTLIADTTNLVSKSFLTARNYLTTPSTFTFTKNTSRDSIIATHDGVRSAVKDSIGVAPTLSYTKNTSRDSFVITYNSIRTAVADSFANSTVRKVDTIYRTAGKDSIIYNLNGIRRAIKDSVGGGSGWGLSGNAGTAYGTNFVGTTDNVGLQFKTNNTSRMYMTAAGLVSIGSGTSSTYPFEISTTSGNSSIETAGRIRSIQGADGYGGFVHYYGGGNWSTFGTNSSGQTIIINGTPGGGTVPVIYFNNGYGSNGNCGIGGVPVTSAKLALTSTTTGFLPPVMTTTQRDAISTPATGLMIFCSDCTATDASTGVTQTYNGSTWKNFW